MRLSQSDLVFAKAVLVVTKARPALTMQEAIVACRPIPGDVTIANVERALLDVLALRYWPTSAPCRSCKGSGVTRAGSIGGTYPRKDEPCWRCDGVGAFDLPDLDTMVKAVTSAKSRTGLVSKRPAGKREYYLWRWTRFHTGADVTMPMMADLGGDPFEPVMQRASEELARRLTRHGSAGLARWGAAFGFETGDTRGMPASAHESGPVVLDGDKPASEAHELAEPCTDGLEPDARGCTERGCPVHGRGGTAWV